MSCEHGGLCKFSSREVQHDIAVWVSLDYFEVDSDYYKKIRRRLKSKYKLAASSDALRDKIELYRKVYYGVAKILPDYIMPSRSGRAEFQYVRYAEITDFISRKYKSIPKKIIRKIIDRVLECEYLC